MKMQIHNKKYRHWFVVAFSVAAIFPIALALISTLLINRNEQYVLHDKAAQQAYSTSVGLVLGSLVTKDGKPYQEVQSRLDVAADALEAGYVDKLIVSGDNRFVDYNEPAVMKKYLVEQRHVDASKIQEDFAGRSTYESCERAAKIFKLREVIIFSADSHLPRAIYLCRHFGIQAHGIPSSNKPNNVSGRETMARIKAVLNVYVKGEKTILGAPIPIN